LAGWDASQLLFLDESAANERTMDRKYGWAPIGVTPHEYKSIKHSERWSILPVYTVDGFYVWDIIQGSYTKELFNEFIRTQVLPCCTPYPGPRSILVLDNARIHHSEVLRTAFHQLTAQELEQMCLEAKIKLEYLPPYSPDYNPIEEAFAELKAWMKKNYLLADGYETFQGFLEAGLKHMNRKPGSHFRSCHIMM